MNTQQSNNADDNVNQSSGAVVSPRSVERRRGLARSPPPQVPTLRTIPEEQGEDEDEPTVNSNTNNSSLIRPLDLYTNINANNSAGSSTGDMALLDLIDEITVSSPARSISGASSAWSACPVKHVDDDGFETVDLFTV